MSNWRQLGYRIEAARSEWLAELPAIERRAAERFDPADLPPEALDDATEIEELAAACAVGRLLVAVAADGQPAGFALRDEVDGRAHLQELDVAPEHGGRGLGRALVEASCAAAREEGHREITLTTFEHVPWNRPFYERAGFRVLAEATLPPGLRAHLADERRAGLRNRVAMARSLERRE